jgi:hypothetical protein
MVKYIIVIALFMLAILAGPLAFKFKQPMFALIGAGCFILAIALIKQINKAK